MDGPGCSPPSSFMRISNGVKRAPEGDRLVMAHASSTCSYSIPVAAGYEEVELCVPSWRDVWYTGK